MSSREREARGGGRGEGGKHYRFYYLGNKVQMFTGLRAPGELGREV